MRLLVPADSENGDFLQGYIVSLCVFLFLSCLVYVLGKCYSGGDGIVASCERYVVLKLESPLLLQSCDLHTVLALSKEA